MEGNRYQNIGFCLSKSVKVNKHEKFPGVSISDIVKDSFCSGTLRILLLDLIPSSSLNIFYKRLETFLSTYKMFDIIICDFNINALANNNLQQVMSQYQLIKHESKHISGPLSDHFTITNKHCKKFP